VKISVAEPDIGKDEIKAVMETMRSGWVTQGKRVEELEKEFARFCGVRHAVAVSSGTAALHTALTAIGIKNRDEVITTPLSCIVTANPIRYLHAKPVFADINPKTLNIEPAKIATKISEKTKAIVPVHLLGHPVDMGPVMDIAETHSLQVIEDAAQAAGAKYKGKRVGSIGHIGCFSFYVGKLMTTAEGGIITTNDAELAEKMRTLRNLGSSRHKKFHHPLLGYNYKMSDIHAAIGIVQLKKLDKYIKKKRENIAFLNEKLEDLNIQLPTEEKYAFNVYYAYHLLLRTQGKKEKAVKSLESQGVETRPLFSFIPAQPCYLQYKKSVRECPIARETQKRGLYVSNSPELTKCELEYLASSLRKAVGES
jgi:perosamine synthetase